MDEQQLLVTAKFWWHSFTIWLNGVFAFLLSVDLSGALETLPTVQQYLTPHLFKFAFVGLTVVNILLRTYKTSAPIKRGGNAG
jgi:hypothetical protein